MVKKRIDSLLVDKGMVESRAKAQALIMAGDVTADGKVVNKAGALVNESAELSISQISPFVGRGGFKLEHALETFGVDVSSMIAADIGASTGGFTDCLLQRGASRVYAIDVGYGQLDYRLRKDPRVVVMERVNARYGVDIPEKVDIAVIDVSFISVEKIIPAISGLLKDNGSIIVLLKPQFEARREEVGKGGVIKNPEVHAKVLGRFIRWEVENKLRIKNLTASPVEGASGNREFLVLLKLT